MRSPLDASGRPDDGIKDGLTSAEQAEVVQLRRDKRRLEMENEILRARGRVLREGCAPKMMFPLVCDLAAEGVPTCRVLGFSAQALYKWRAQPVSVLCAHARRRVAD